jgi:hypothetical protein
MVDLTHYDDLDKALYQQAKRLLFMVAIARATGVDADPKLANIIDSTEIETRSELVRLAKQAEARSIMWSQQKDG